MSVSSSDGYINVNYGSVDNVEQALQDCDQSIGKVLDRLQNVIGNLQGSWAGVSQDEYQQVQARWTADLNDMQALLVKYSGVLDEMKINYGNTDNHLAMSWSEIQ